MNRRRFLAGSLLLCSRYARAVSYPAVAQGRLFTFPRDYGSHSAFRSEWWYVTGIGQDDAGRDYGLQVTFFRNRPGVAEDEASAFAPRQLLFAHAAVGDPRSGRLLQDQRAARAGFGLAEAGTETADLIIDDWSLRRAENAYIARIAGREFALDLRFAPTQPLWLQGENGYSRKGPHPSQASYYTTEPQLALTGQIVLAGRRITVKGRAWLDHEWASTPLAAEAVGWNWTGINLDDGSALMVYTLRDKSGGTFWSGGALRSATGAVQAFAAADIVWTPLRRWRSPRTQVDYPVAMSLLAGGRHYELHPLFDDQELDARASTGTLYWEGAVRAFIGEREVGRGFLELTGYGDRLVY